MPEIRHQPPPPIPGGLSQKRLFITVVKFLGKKSLNSVVVSAERVRYLVHTILIEESVVNTSLFFFNN